MFLEMDPLNIPQLKDPLEIDKFFVKEEVNLGSDDIYYLEMGASELKIYKNHALFLNVMKFICFLFRREAFN